MNRLAHESAIELNHQLSDELAATVTADKLTQYVHSTRRQGR
jgi:hypothetical protein